MLLCGPLIKMLYLLMTGAASWEHLVFVYICENKGADHLCRNRAANQGLCFRFL